MVTCLELGADLHTAQLMPLPLAVSCFSKIQIGFAFLVPAHPGSPGKRAVKGCVCVCFSKPMFYYYYYTRLSATFSAKTSLDLNEARWWGYWDGVGISWTICKQSTPCSRLIHTTRELSGTTSVIVTYCFFHHHHYHHFICPIIQQYAHLHEYNSRRVGQQGPIWTLTAALKRSIKTVTGCIFYHTDKNITSEKKTREINLFNAIPKNI